MNNPLSYCGLVYASPVDARISASRKIYLYIIRHIFWPKINIGTQKKLLYILNRQKLGTILENKVF